MSDERKNVKYFFYFECKIHLNFKKTYTVHLLKDVHVNTRVLVTCGLFFIYNLHVYMYTCTCIDYIDRETFILTYIYMRAC